MSDALSRNVLTSLLEYLQDAVFVIKEEYCVYANPLAIELFGYSSSELHAQPFFDFVHPDDKELVEQRYKARLQGEKVKSEYSFRVVTKKGEIREVKVRVGIVEDDDGICASIGSLLDITDSEKTKRSLLHSQADIESILNNLPDVFYRTDMNGIVTLMSPSVFDALGYHPEEMIGRPLKDYYYSPNDREKIVQALIDGNGKARHVEAWLRHKDGSSVWVSTNAYIRLDEYDQPMFVEGIARNITERKELENKLEYLARYDSLTGLLNRRAFLEETEYQIDLSHRYSRSFALMMIDLDWFKKINDEYGHQVGDGALRYFSSICKSVFRKTDVIGRIGGEEFAVLMPETPLENAKEMLFRLRNKLNEELLCEDDKRIKLSFSAGLVGLLKNDQSVSDLFRRVDRLLYKAKKNGRDQVVEQE